MPAACARQISALDRIVLVILRQHHARDRHLAAADVRVRIDASAITTLPARLYS